MVVLQNKRDVKAHIKGFLTPLATEEHILELDEVKMLVQQISSDAGISPPLSSAEVDAAVFNALKAFLHQQRAGAEAIHRVEELQAALLNERAAPLSAVDKSKPAKGDSTDTPAPSFSFNALQQHLQQKRNALRKTTRQAPTESSPTAKATRTEVVAEGERATAAVVSSAPSLPATTPSVASAEPETRPEVRAGAGDSGAFQVAPLNDDELYEDLVTAPHTSGRGGYEAYRGFHGYGWRGGRSRGAGGPPHYHSGIYPPRYSGPPPSHA